MRSAPALPTQPEDKKGGVGLWRDKDTLSTEPAQSALSLIWGVVSVRTLSRSFMWGATQYLPEDCCLSVREGMNKHTRSTARAA